MPSMSISDASETTGVAVDTLRYWERIGLLVDVPRDEGGRRRYDDEALRWIRFVRRMRSTGMPTADLARYAEAVREGHGTVAERRGMLEAHRRHVAAARAELDDVLALLDGKLADYAAAEAGPEDDRPDVALQHVTRLT